MDRPLPWLRFVDADNVKTPEPVFDGRKIRNDEMDTLGRVGAPIAAMRGVAMRQVEQLLARERDGDTRNRQAGEQEDHDPLSRGPEPSPHLEGRARPGDVIGLDTGGERTHIGDTTEEENRRRIDAEKDAAKRRD